MLPSALYDVAKEILQTGRDRVPHVDRRRLRSLWRYGLIQYEDGFSVKPSVMEDAAEHWTMGVHDAERYGTPAQVAELQDLAKKALAWAATHKVTPDLRRTVYGDLSFDTYVELWEIVTSHQQLFIKGVSHMTKINDLLKKGYIAPAKVTGTYAPTDKARALVQEHGNPFLRAKEASAAERVVARFTSASEWDEAFFEVWAEALDRFAKGLNLNDPEDRATFRIAVAHGTKNLVASGMRGIIQRLGVKPRGSSRSELARTISDAYIAGKRLVG